MMLSSFFSSSSSSIYCLLSLVIFELLTNNVEGVPNNTRIARYPKTQIISLEKSLLGGVYDEEKYHSNGQGEKKNTSKSELSAEDIISKLHWKRVDLETGDQWEYVIDTKDLEKILKKEKDTKGELSKNEDEKDKDKNKDEEEEEEVVCSGKDCEPEEDDSLIRRLWILGSDDRYEITTANWSPVNKVGLLTFSGGYCTGTLIGPKHVLTAGHCVHEGDGGDWYGSFKFYPGRTSSGYSQVYYGVSMWSLTGWTEDGDFDYDIGMVELSTETNLGWVSFGYNTAIDESWYFYSKGYPSDKPYGSMWSTSGYVSEANTNNLEFDTSDTQPGQSGSPMYYYVSSNPIIYGVHSNSAWWSFLFWTEYWNQATRITGTRFSLMCDWIDDYRLGC